MTPKRRPHTEPPSNLDRLDWPDPRHGTRNGYPNHGSNFDRCANIATDCDPDCPWCRPAPLHDIPEATFDRLPRDTKEGVTDSIESGHGRNGPHLGPPAFLASREPRRYRLLWWWRKKRARWHR